MHLPHQYLLGILTEELIRANIEIFELAKI